MAAIECLLHARSFACVSLALASPEGFSYLVELVLPGGDEQLASQPGRQNGAIDEVVVKRDADVGEVVLNVAPRQALWGVAGGGGGTDEQC